MQFELGILNLVYYTDSYGALYFPMELFDRLIPFMVSNNSGVVT